jgi:hypothetical protein
VAGFRDLGAPVVVADRDDFVAAVNEVLGSARPPFGPVVLEDVPVASWHERAESMASLMAQVRRDGSLR